MAGQKEFDAKLTAAEQAVRADEAADDARAAADAAKITELTKVITELRAKAEPDLQPQIDRLDGILALMHAPKTSEPSSGGETTIPFPPR